MAKMKRTCCQAFSQIYLATANFLTLFIGVGVVVLGLYGMFNPITFGNGFRDISIILFVLGAIVMLVSCFGFCGILIKSRRMTNSYVIILLLIVAGQGGIIVYSFYQVSHIDPIAKEIWYTGFNNHTRSSYETNYKCCGYLKMEESPFCSFNFTCAPFFQDSVSSVHHFISYALLGIIIFEVINLVIAGVLGSRYEKLTRLKYGSDKSLGSSPISML